MDCHIFGQGRKGRDKHAWFVLVTNLSPCVGMRVHLWPEKSRSGDMAASERVVEVTKKMVQLPSGPTPPQVCTSLLCVVSSTHENLFKERNVDDFVVWKRRSNQEDLESRPHLRECFS